MLHGLPSYEIDALVLELMFEFDDYHLATLVMYGQWVKVFLSCASIMDPAIGSTLWQHGTQLVVLLAGGDKRTQARDIRDAIELAKNL